MPPPGRFTVGPPLTEMAITFEVVDPVVLVVPDVETVPPPQPAIAIVPVRKSETRKDENRFLCTTCSCLFYCLQFFVIEGGPHCNCSGLTPAGVRAGMYTRPQWARMWPPVCTTIPGCRISSG